MVCRNALGRNQLPGVPFPSNRCTHGRYQATVLTQRTFESELRLYVRVSALISRYARFVWLTSARNLNLPKVSSDRRTWQSSLAERQNSVNSGRLHSPDMRRSPDSFYPDGGVVAEAARRGLVCLLELTEVLDDRAGL